MKPRTLTNAACCTFFLWAWSIVDATEPPALAHNPFARPPSEATSPFVPQLQADGTRPALDLRATMVGTRDRLANVAGKTIGPGDEIQD